MKEPTPEERQQEVLVLGSIIAFVIAAAVAYGIVAFQMGP